MVGEYYSLNMGYNFSWHAHLVRQFQQDHSTQHKVHSAFGYVAIVGLGAHVLFGTKIVLCDPTNQIKLVHFSYLGTCAEVALLGIYGIGYAIAAAREKDKRKKKKLMLKHHYRMITCWLQGTFRSGAIVSYLRNHSYLI